MTRRPPNDPRFADLRGCPLLVRRARRLAPEVSAGAWSFVGALTVEPVLIARTGREATAQLGEAAAAIGRLGQRPRVKPANDGPARPRDAKRGPK